MTLVGSVLKDISMLSRIKIRLRFKKKELFQPKDISASREAPEVRQREARTNSEGPTNVFSEM